MLSIVRTTCAAMVLLLASPACVNDYVVRDEEGAEQGEGTTCALDDCGQGDTAAEGTAFECLRCESDLECGDAWDNCVTLDELGPRCLFACPEAGCPAGMNCRLVTSVDQAMVMQCAPQAGVCEAANAD